MPLPAALSSQRGGAGPSDGQITGGSCGPRKPGPVTTSSGFSRAPTTAVQPRGSEKTTRRSSALALSCSLN
ncbi:MAG: hypothetical protein QOI32_21, partial [Thermoleophilaceae bacterium]|nr:hypothetical protein [Thermoleophilaceae bacterium]